jgi:hypothetical protein
MRLIGHLSFICVLACGLLAEPAGAAIPDAEKTVLRDLYVSTGGDNWLATVANVHRWFADGTDPCTWFGVGCDAAHEHVTGLGLSGGNLTGSLPANLATLKYLRYLVVDNNRLSGPLPSLEGLADLQTVFVQHNQLSGPIPSLAGLTSLAYFAADHNDLGGHIPSSLSDLPQLQYFVIDHNRLNGRVPKAPPTLTRFSAALCPNLLDTRPSTDPAIDAGWNNATGLAAWSSGPESPCAANPEDLAALHAFTTSATGTGDMHSWDDVLSTNLAGLAAADGVCQARATAANLADPDGYVAWLSDRDNDAYCRVLGLSGKKADNCGLAEPPAGAGPWLRTDDVPFADTIDNALDDNVVYSTLNVDESGTPLPDSFESFTATDRDGTFITKFDNNADCERWTTTRPLQNFGSAPALGSTLASSGDWTFDEHGAGCNSRHRLTCLQKGSAPALSGHGQPGRREAFLTSADVSGNLGGIAGADAVCRSAAAAAHLHQPDSFKALITSAALGANIIDRFEFDGPWYRRDGLLFAHNKAELIGGAVTLPLNVTETGTYSGIAVALTGARPDGTPSGHDCSNWGQEAQPSLASGALANTIAFYGNGYDWLGPADVSCVNELAPGDWPRKLFCLSDSDVVFHGEFDSAPATP